MSSQVIDVSLGLVLMFLVVSLLASGVVEIVATATRKRATDLEATITKLLGSDDLAQQLKQTSIYKALAIGSATGKETPAGSEPRKPSYISARAFADASIEMLAKKKKGGDKAGDILGQIENGPLGDRLLAISAEVNGDLTAAKAQLEAWYDEVMERVEGAYKRWSRWILFGVGLVLAVGLNASATRVASELWRDPIVRQAVVDASNDVLANPDAQNAPRTLDEVAKAIGDLDALKLPIGWNLESVTAPSLALLAAGWLITAVMTMLGASFWFNTLRRVSALRGVGGKPPPAALDPMSSTSRTVSNAATLEGMPIPSDTKVPAEQRLLALIPDLA